MIKRWQVMVDDGSDGGLVTYEGESETAARAALAVAILLGQAVQMSVSGRSGRGALFPVVSIREKETST